MKKRKHLTIPEKENMLKEKGFIPLCVYVDPKEEKKRKKEKEKLAKKFAKNTGIF